MQELACNICLPGACRSLLPRELFRTLRSLPKSANVCLVAANGSAIPTYGYENLTVLFGNFKFNWNFLVADVTLPILDADFLSHHLLVNVTHQRLVKADSYLLTPLQTIPSNLPPSPLQHTHGCLHPLPRHTRKFSFQIITNRTKFRRLILDRLAAAEQTFTEIEERGLCQKASSLWSSPLHIVLKKDGSFHQCGDCRRLNMQTEPDHYLLPNIADVTSYLHKAKVFSTLDLL
ncbi:uncharacterized protein [Palaemon carinicauda]|uniref:uncharacterized protein n=1 Tax=Palaemon carinicauda TaxID=392227 RepID=UPI0035B63455